MRNVHLDDGPREPFWDDFRAANCTVNVEVFANKANTLNAQSARTTAIDYLPQSPVT